MVDPVPYLVEQILAQLSTPLEQRLELGGRGIAHECRHMVKATARRGVRFMLNSVSCKPYWSHAARRVGRLSSPAS